MLYTVCKHIKNFFVKERFCGRFEIANGSLSLPLLDGQYFLIEGSVLNDGVYKYPATGLQDEIFTGAIVAMAIPKDFISLCNEIKEYNGKATATPFKSESFGGYSYTKDEDSTWQTEFKKRLDAWRKL